MESPRINFVVIGKKPRKADLPGLEIIVGGKYPSGVRVWRCCLDQLFAN
jgi:hypothetical protein